jgi:hypothetical protein
MTMKRTERGSLAFAMVACLIGTPALAQDSAEQETQAAMPVEQATVEWAIAPVGTTLPEGTVLQDGMLLPPGTILPGGAILPGATATPELVPSPTPIPTPEQVSAPEPAPAPELAPAPESGPEPRLPGQSTLGVPHISGGIGASEREAMEQVKSQYNLRLLFAVAGSGAYLSNIRVQIDDAVGPTLLTTITIGPWFYASLAPGEYVLQVEYAGQRQTRQVVIPASGAVAESFYWPAG